MHKTADWRIRTKKPLTDKNICVHDRYIMLHKVIKKVGPELHIFLNAVVLLFCVVLVLAVVVLVFKHEKLKGAMYFFAQQAAMASKQQYIGADATEDAQMLATTIVNVPTGKVLWTDKESLQKLVSLLSHQTGRDIVVEDTHQFVLADTLPANVGKMYTNGGNADLQTIKDGKPRRFTEKSPDYPAGVDEVVVPVKDSNGVTVGAVIMSTSHIFDDK